MSLTRFPKRKKALVRSKEEEGKTEINLLTAMFQVTVSV